jgi:hypothetical protein
MESSLVKVDAEEIGRKEEAEQGRVRAQGQARARARA